jgi:hypothetical protein
MGDFVAVPVFNAVERLYITLHARQLFKRFVELLAGISVYAVKVFLRPLF